MNSHTTSRENVRSDKRRDTSGASTSTLLANDNAYSFLLARITPPERRLDADGLLASIQRAALFAGQFHSGRFADGALENVALSVGEQEAVYTAASNPGDKRRVLHVLTRAPSVAGHTRMLGHWIRADESSRHSLALTDPKGPACAPFLAAAVTQSGGTLTVLAGATLLSRARELATISRAGADLVVLHHHSWDVVPVVAFALDGGPPVALLNHADHEFWLGATVADAVINLRSAGAEQATRRRFATRNLLLPVPLTDSPMQAKERARHALDIPADATVILTVGRGEKYRPTGTHDFFATAARILMGLPNALLIVVGESHEGIAPFLRAPLHEQVRLVGAVDDASLFRAAADVYIESFPFGSQTALLEACLSGLPAVPAYAPLFPLLVANDDAIVKVLPNPTSEAEYVERTRALATDANLRLCLGAELRRRIVATHLGEHWLEQLRSIYEVTDTLAHAPRRIPATNCITTPGDVALAERHTLANRLGVRRGPLRELLHASNVARMVGDDCRARNVALFALRRYPATVEAWRLVGTTLLGPIGARLLGRKAPSWT